MSPILYLSIGAVVLLVSLLAWALKSLPNRGLPGLDELNSSETNRSHATYLPQIQQALQQNDLEFLELRGAPTLVNRVRKERSHIALLYLDALRSDFQKLLNMARVIAVLSPRVAAIQEFERLRLVAEFMCRYQFTRACLKLGLAPLPQVRDLSFLLGALSARVECAMTELGERAVLASEMSSSLERRDVDFT